MCAAPSCSSQTVAEGGVSSTGSMLVSRKACGEEVQCMLWRSSSQSRRHHRSSWDSSSHFPPEAHPPGLALLCSASPKGLPLMLLVDSGHSTFCLDGDELQPCAFMFRIAHPWKKCTAKPLSSHLGMKAITKAEGGFGPQGTWALFPC